MVTTDSKASRSIWQRASRSHPCPICGKPDWCLFIGPTEDPMAAICQRIESEKKVGTKGAGWLHRLRDNTLLPEQRKVTVSTSTPSPVDFDAMASACRRELGQNGRCMLAAELGVMADSLERLHVGWSPRQRAYTFPMRDAFAAARGIRLRGTDGRKWSVRGGHEGLFMPHNLVADDLLVVCEGPTDTAALLDIGFEAVGRPSCTGGAKLLEELIRSCRPSEVVIVADHDAPGKRGAISLASSLVMFARNVRIVYPPGGIKDAREWRRQGAIRSDVLDAVHAAPVLQLHIATREVRL